MLVELKNTTRKLCVIGDPVLHSKSPLIHNTMLAALGLDYVYLCQPVPAGGAAAWLAAAKCAGYAGFNATMPHKEALVPLMDDLDPDAQLYGAVNTVCLRDGRAIGYNTDGLGFLRALEDLGARPEGKRVVLLGAGGAAKAVALKLAQQGAERVWVCNRTAERAQALCAQDPAGRLAPAGFGPEELRALCREAELLVNCTSLGMAGGGGQFQDLSFVDALPPEAAVFDAIYHPAETPLLARARAAGHRTANGLGMLLYQAVFALERFTGTAIDAAAMAERVGPLLAGSERGPEGPRSSDAGR